MSEPIWCVVKVKTPRSWNVPGNESLPADPPWFVEWMAEELCNGCGPDDDVWKNEGDYSVWSVNGEGNYGLSALEDQLDWLRENHIPFYAQSDAKYEYLGDFTYNDGVNPERSCEYGGEDAVLPHSTYAWWIKALNDDPTSPSIAERIAAYFQPWECDLDKASIDHLPTECPPRPEETE